MHPAAAPVGEGFREEAGIEAVLSGDRLDRRPEGEEVVGGRQGVGKPEINLVLAGAGFVVGGLGVEAHLLQRQADLPPDVFPPVEGGNVGVARVVVGGQGRFPELVGLKEVELALGPHLAGEPVPGGVGHRPLEDRAGAPFVRVPSEVTMSQKNRMTRPADGRQGRAETVPASGFR